MQRIKNKRQGISLADVFSRDPKAQKPLPSIYDSVNSKPMQYPGFNSRSYGE
jgi:hypothetical protein